MNYESLYSRAQLNDLIVFLLNNYTFIFRFAVNLECDDGDNVALHVNPRLEEQKFIVRNSLKNGVWGPEEREGCVTFERGTQLSVNILCQEDGFKVTSYIYILILINNLFTSLFIYLMSDNRILSLITNDY